MYNVIVRTTPPKSAGGWESAQWDGGQQVQLSIGDHERKNVIRTDGFLVDPRNPMLADVKSQLGTIKLEAGEQHVTFKVVRMNRAPKLGLRFMEIQLEPAQ